MKNELVLLVLLFVPLTTTAADSEAPLQVLAEDWEADRGAGISVFTGDVQISKGSIRIKADEVRLRAVDGEVREGTLIGAPVQFRQQPEGEPLIEGEASRIEYDAVNRVIVLTGKAWVRQGGDEFRGETIRYDIDARKVLATSSKSTPERVKIIFQPKSADDSGKPQTSKEENN